MVSSFSMASSAVAVVLALFVASPALAIDGAMTPELMGCYASSQGLTYNDTAINQSSGYCQTQCFSMKKGVQAMINGKDCWCGDNMPPLTAKVDGSNCDTPCAGYPLEICGSSPGASNSYYSVWNSGLNSKVYNLENSSSSSTSSPTAAPTSRSTTEVTAPVGTVVITTSATASSSSSPSSGPNTAGIAAGVVVGIIAVAAIAGGIWFYMRAKRRREVEEEHKRQAAVTAFVNSGKPNSSAGTSHDTRLDPTMTQRRMSDGSIADNQDYSRRILKVTNA